MVLVEALTPPSAQPNRALCAQSLKLAQPFVIGVQQQMVRADGIEPVGVLGSIHNLLKIQSKSFFKAPCRRIEPTQESDNR